MTDPAPAVFLSAGDPSGDPHGAAVAYELRRRWPEATLFGLAGPEMQRAGVEPLVDFDRLTVMGFAEVLRHLPFFWRLMRKVGQALDERNPSLVLPIDYPGFNLRLCRKAKARGLPVLYYIAPQVWAWHRSRAREMAQSTDRLAVILPFEEALFRDAGVAARFVGHPLLDRERADQERGPFCRSLGADPDRPVLALFPGSRRQEVERHLQLFSAAAEMVCEHMPEIQPVLAVSGSVDAAAYEGWTRFRTTESPTLLRHAHIALVKSGTSTLQAALARVPMVIAYRTHPLTYLVARRLVELPHIGLANLVAGTAVAPEFIQDEATPRSLAESLLARARDGEVRDRALVGMDTVRAALTYDGDARSAAARVVDMAAELMA